MITDPIADFLIQIKNGYLARKKEIIVPFSIIREKLAQILMVEGYLEKFEARSSKLETKKELVLTLKYNGKKSVLTEVKRVSKPGLRIYVNKNEIPRVLGDLGMVIISTPQGLMTGKTARKQGLGGELICKVW